MPRAAADFFRRTHHPRRGTGIHRRRTESLVVPSSREEIPIPQSGETPLARKQQTPVDAFLFDRLSSAGISPAAPADRATLLRRLHFDLTGLPPSRETIAEFTSDDSPDAVRRLTDRLLASPHYGVRWGQHWLDVVRFAESEGFEYDRHLPGAWMFRDYVVGSFNDDKPFDEFIREQIAGDELAGNGELAVPANDLLSVRQNAQRMAAGLHRLGAVRRNAGNPDVSFSRNEVLTERTDIIGSAFLGLTIGCARCHDHKFDPIHQTDYYRLQAFLASTYAHDAPLVNEPDAKEWQATTDRLNKQIKHLKDRSSQTFGEEQARIKAEIASLQNQLPAAIPTVFTVRVNNNKRTTIHLLDRGDENKPLQELGMRPPGILLPPDTSEIPAAAAQPKTQLADWLTEPQNPLTARVLANRIWQYHFGDGLVITPNDFGANGGYPTHPDLLDWLSNEVVRAGWSIKQVHRTLIDSYSYQQSSTANEYAMQADPANELLSRFRRRRITAEELRDAMLSVSGTLNDSMTGRSVMVPVDPELIALLYKPDQWEETPNTAEHNRRSVYLLAKRNLRLPMLEVFDQPSLQTSCACREQSTHAPQALAMLNGKWASQIAESFAKDLLATCGSDHDRLIEEAFLRTTGQPPTDDQWRLSRTFLRAESSDTTNRELRLRIEEFALAMLNLNAFLYVE